MIKIREIDHLVLRVSDLEPMLRFYCDVLGCSVERRQDEIGLVQLRAGKCLLDLVPVTGRLGALGGAAPGPGGRNLDHFCFRVEPFVEAEIRAALGARGIQAGPAEPRYGAEGAGPSIYVQDPEGNTVELKGPAQAQALPWWRGARGEWYVAAQAVLMALVFLGPRQGPAWPVPPRLFAWALGLPLCAAGLALFSAGLVRLGSSLTPLPHPKPGARLVESGPYRLVRHPIYGGGILLALGWACLVQGWLTLLYALALACFLDVKSRREERWLAEAYPGYGDYRRRVRKLIPFLY